MTDPLVSICIPAYENPAFIKRLLDSILTQTYPHIEIIVSDDSAGEDIKNALVAYAGKLNIRYFKNTPALKTPANWNQALDKATGDFLILMHQDDWFAGPGAIKKYIDAFDKNPHADFVFCLSMGFDQKIHKHKAIVLHGKILRGLQKNPERLLLGNIIGPPSNVMMRKKIAVRYHQPFIWLVDVEYYIRLLKTGYHYYFLDEPLVAVGLHDQQTTIYVRQNKKIILTEHLLLATELGPAMFSNWRIYDLYWRLLRNYAIRSTDELKNFGVELQKLPFCLIRMLNFQKRIPATILKNGLASKLFMLISFRFRKK